MILVKSQKELDIMRKAGELVALALDKLSLNIAEGVTTAELDRIAEEFIRSKGAVPSFKGYHGLPGAKDYPASICASINNEVVHGIPDNRKLKNGDIISIDIGIYYQGFHGDAARTFAVGKISEKASLLIEVTKQSFYEGLRFAMNGNRIYDISSAIQDYVEKFGFSVVRDYVGHGIGKNMHEEPQIPNFRTKQRGPRLMPGMTLAIEPMVNEGAYNVKLLDNMWTVVTQDGSLSAHYENTIAVTENEPIILTKLD
jgi:methionyl aminopeptidase